MTWTQIRPVPYKDPNYKSITLWSRYITKNPFGPLSHAFYPLQTAFSIEDGQASCVRYLWIIQQKFTSLCRNFVTAFQNTQTEAYRVRHNKSYTNFPGVWLRLRSRDPGFDSRRCHIFWEAVVSERGPLSLVGITEELLEWKSSGPGSRKSRLTAVGIRCADHAIPSNRKSCH
jgi:hypothetical protein